MAKILIVDDSTVVRLKLRQILEKYQHEIVDEAENGQKGLDKYLLLKPDLVTMDMNMPDMNGLETIEQIIKLDPEANIIMISSYSDKSKIMEAMKKGARGYILKPFEEGKVIKIINSLLA